MNAALPARSLDDRLNPILVKEVRQSLRGRYFRALFWLTLGVATLLGLSIVAEAGSRNQSSGLGQSFFMAMYGCLSAAVHAFVPFSAFLATSSEWDENTHDLLVLSNLRPRQIVYGKLLSALIQALLYYSTFGPFLVFAFLMSGVDLRAVAVLLATSMALCAALTLLGIALASLSSAKAPRVLLMALFGVGLVSVWGFSISFSMVVISRPQTLREPMALTFVAAFVLATLLAGGFFAALAVARLSHEEENRSSGMRALGVTLMLACAAFAGWLSAQFGEVEPTWALQLLVMFPLALLWLYFLTEPEALGRHVTLHVSKRPLLALLSTPFLPGGGRGAWLLALQMALALGAVVLGMSLSTVAPIERWSAAKAVASAYCYVWIYIAAPAAIASWFVKSLRGRILVRAFILGLAPLVLLGPPLAGLVFAVPEWIDFLHPLNPAWAVSELMDSRTLPPFLVGLVWICAAVAFALNLPRMLRGVVEVLDASRARRARSSGGG